MLPLGCALPQSLGCGLLLAWRLEEALTCPKEQRSLEPEGGAILRAMCEADGCDPKGVWRISKPFEPEIAPEG